MDANALIERAIGFRGSTAPTTVEITKNLFDNNPVAIHFSGDGSFVGVDIHKNTFDNNTTDFDSPGSSWTADADKNFYAAGVPAVSDTGAGNTVTVVPSLKSAQHCRGVR